MTVNVFEARDADGKNLKHWLELETPNHRINFRYEEFVSESEKEQIYEAIIDVNSDWSDVLSILRPHIDRIVDGAMDAVMDKQVDEPVEFNDTFSVIK